ncbi:lipopolysaccharide biosynthesis protein [Caulobacter sp. SSI4214]|uniref:lipopolysaccharide biosynthesis protein n=1 Tax=Caulobacter sp. SSI4214 TaxID=2575739 RepID=UPI00143C23B5|nr:lipopolysaccharide biosynthesis protein [Caulobacter sp. SSI4214]
MKIIFMLKSSQSKRILFGFGANMLGKVFALLIQFISIPVLSKYWGAAGYGTWLMLSAVPAYVALGGLGFGNAAATEMTRCVARGNQAQAITVYQSAWTLITASVGIIVLLVLGGAFLGSSLGQRSAKEFLPEICLLSAYSFMVVQSSTVQTAYKSTHRYALGTAIFDLMALLEGLAVIVSAILGYKYIFSIASMLLVRLVGHVAYYAIIKHLEPWFELGVKHANIATIKELFAPAMALLVLGASSALAIQGVILTLGIVTSPAITASYSAARTICRIPLQMSDLFGRATLPELTSAHGRNDRILFRKITIANFFVSLSVAGPAFVIISIFGPRIARIVSHGQLEFSNPLFIFLGLSTLAQSSWQAIGLSLQATNDQDIFSYPYFVAALVMALGPWLTHPFGFGAAGAAAVVALCDVGIFLTVCWGWARQTRSRWDP